MRTLFTADFGSNTSSEGGPAVANGVLYQGGFDGSLNAYSASGCGQPSCQPLWRGMAAGDFTSTPAVAGGLVFIASAGHFLYAFPAAGCGAAVCAPRWKAHLLDPVVDSSVAVADGLAYVGGTACRHRGQGVHGHLRQRQRAQPGVRDGAARLSMP